MSLMWALIVGSNIAIGGISSEAECRAKASIVTSYLRLRSTAYTCFSYDGVAIAGPVGPQGPIGLTGPIGPQGIQGIQGPPGPAGTGTACANMGQALCTGP